MKPTSHRTGRNGRSGAGETVSHGFPVIDSAYQSITLDGYRGRCASQRAPSFRTISNGYFKNEARQSFVTEAVFFAVMIGTAAWPVLQSAWAMTDLVRAFAGA
jgi:hypothetical protein